MHNINPKVRPNHKKKQLQNTMFPIYEEEIVKFQTLALFIFSQTSSWIFWTNKTFAVGHRFY